MTTKLVALLVEDDAVFALPAWNKAIPMMAKQGFLLTHVAVVPSRVAKYQGLARLVWYLRVFGLGNAIRMAMFALIERRRRGQEEPRTWEELALTHGLVLERFAGPNGIETQTFLRNSQCDVLHVLAAVDLKPTVLEIPRVGAIAHHASLLPACRGSFPYFWARLYGEPMGHSMHTLTAEPGGEAPILVQNPALPAATRSMLAFHVWAARQYPLMAVDATTRLLARKRAPRVAPVEASYFSLPTRRDRIEFEQLGGRISTWRDLHLTVNGPASADELAEIRRAETAFYFPQVQSLQLASEPRQSGGGGLREMGKVVEMPARRRRQAGE